MPPPTRPAPSPPTPLSKYRRAAPLWQQLALGGASCGIATTFTHPLDTVKLRLQLQGTFSRHAEPRYTGLLTGLSSVARDEGLFALYQGLSPAILRAATYSATRLGLYEPLRTSFARAAAQDHPSFGIKVSAAVCSGAMGAFVGNPCELIKVRMQQGEVHRYRNVFHGLATIIRQDGIAALWVGTVPAAMRAALLTSSQLATYDHTYVPPPPKSAPPFSARIASLSNRIPPSPQPAQQAPSEASHGPARGANRPLRRGHDGGAHHDHCVHPG